jgi:hypothetical protein
MLCCQQEGIITNKTWAHVWVLCTHDVYVGESCFNISGNNNGGNGPGNATIYRFLQYNNGDSATHLILNWANDTTNYNGTVTVDLQARRQTNQGCALNLFTPCTYNNALVSQVAPVAAASFSIANSPNYYPNYIAPPYGGVSALLDNFVWYNSSAPANAPQCVMQTTGALSPTFVTKGSNGWLNYNDGFQFACNSTFLATGAPVVTASRV